MRLVKGNSLVFPLLRGYATSYSCVPDEPIDEMHTTGGNLVLVAGLQARNNARIAITGSIELFSDEFVNANVERVGQEPYGTLYPLCTSSVLTAVERDLVTWISLPASLPGPSTGLVSCAWLMPATTASERRDSSTEPTA